MSKTAKTVALADVLWRAANEVLWDGTAVNSGPSFSCHAVRDAVDPWNWDSRQSVAAIEFIEALGCDSQVGHTFGTNSARKRQQLRYMWLLLAMHVAEDEGITVEIEENA